ncbi:MAG: hypothetical protein AAF280_14165 [Pseudomonadota bacterium]
MQQSQKTEDLKDPDPRHAGQDGTQRADLSPDRPKDTPAPHPITDWAGL